MTEAAARRTALISGASSGIGLAFAHVYARNNYDVILTARRTDRLEALAQELRDAHGCAAYVVPTDLSRAGAAQQIYAHIERRGLVVDALVNNAGYGVKGNFDTAPWPAQRDLLEVLVMALCEMTHLVLPGMRERGFGRIINVASLAGFAPATIGATLYAPAKAFVIRFSQSLALETRGSGVHVTALCPGFTHTEFHDGGELRADIAGLPKAMWMEAKTVAAQGFDAVEQGQSLCVNGWHNQILAAICQHTPHGLALWMTRKLMKP